MFAEDFTPSRPPEEVMAETVIRSARSADEQWAEHYGSRVIVGLLECSLTPEKAAFLARMAGSYGLRALAHRENVAEGFRVIRGAFGAR